jgi:hypothetical protein
VSHVSDVAEQAPSEQQYGLLFARSQRIKLRQGVTADALSVEAAPRPELGRQPHVERPVDVGTPQSRQERGPGQAFGQAADGALDDLGALGQVRSAHDEDHSLAGLTNEAACFGEIGFAEGHALG